MWLLFSQGKYDYDENFKAVSDYAKDHPISGVTGMPTSDDESVAG
jgi:hypothetical protein